MNNGRIVNILARYRTNFSEIIFHYLISSWMKAHNFELLSSSLRK